MLAREFMVSPGTEPAIPSPEEYSNNPDVAKKFVQKVDLKLPVLLDKHVTISKRFNVTGLPCQYVIDRQGFLRFRYLGCSEAVKAKLEENLRELLSTS